MIIGIGVDVVPVARFAASLDRTPGLAERLFTERECSTASGGQRGPDSLAARFAAKEAVAKALGGGAGMLWTDVEVDVDEVGRPHLRIAGTAAVLADALGVTHWHVSLSHDGGIAAATVIAEART